MAENSITIVEKNSFKDIYQATINISHNMIEKIEPKAFENCVNITTLDLSHNRLMNFSKNSFDETTFATIFQLSHNMLTNLAQVINTFIHHTIHVYHYKFNSIGSYTKYDWS